MSKVFIEETTLTNIGSAIREKTGKTDLIAPGDMPAEIKAIVSGGGSGGGNEPTAEELTLTGNCEYRFANGGWDWIVEKYGDKMTTKDITDAKYMFSDSNLERIPFDLNFDSTEEVEVSSLLCMINLKEVPKINGLKPSKIDYIFSNCQSLRELSWESVKDIDWSYIESQTSGSASPRKNTFTYCYSLRSFPIEFLNHGNPYSSNSNGIYQNLFQACRCLDEVIDLPVLHNQASWTSNGFYYTFRDCCRLKNLTFKLQDNGTPYVRSKWSKQAIDLTTNVGYVTSSATITNTNGGITADKLVTDDASYQALKNDPDWFTTNMAYSRYNHDSAVATINSLPDLSGGAGSNSIKFKGAAGSATDGGAINTLTEEEIAVAAAKGWTVSFA